MYYAHTAESGEWQPEYSYNYERSILGSKNYS